VIETSQRQITYKHGTTKNEQTSVYSELKVNRTVPSASLIPRPVNPNPVAAQDAGMPLQLERIITRLCDLGISAADLELMTKQYIDRCSNAAQPQPRLPPMDFRSFTKPGTGSDPIPGFNNAAALPRDDFIIEGSLFTFLPYLMKGLALNFFVWSEPVVADGKRTSFNSMSDYLDHYHELYTRSIENSAWRDVLYFKKEITSSKGYISEIDSRARLCLMRRNSPTEHSLKIERGNHEVIAVTMEAQRNATIRERTEALLPGTMTSGLPDSQLGVITLHVCTGALFAQLIDSDHPSSLGFNHPGIRFCLNNPESDDGVLGLISFPESGMRRQIEVKTVPTFSSFTGRDLNVYVPSCEVPLVDLDVNMITSLGQSLSGKLQSTNSYGRYITSQENSFTPALPRPTPPTVRKPYIILFYNEQDARKDAIFSDMVVP